MKFYELEKKYSVNWSPEKIPSSLSEWYLSVRDTNINQLAVGDVCRALRQDLFISEVLPFAVELLKEDILAGDRYDGELVSALSGIKAHYWCSNLEAAHLVFCALEGVELTSEDAEFLGDASTLTRILKELERKRGETTIS